jgi:PknH-like extracellular domain
MINRRLLLALGLALALGGCTRVVDAPPPAAGPPVAPITAGQVGDLLSEKAQPDDDPNLFVTVEPEECAGLAREVDPPFIFDTTPAAHDGGHWFADDIERSVSVQEMVGVYRANFDPKAAIDKVKRTIESCQHDTLTVTAMKGEVVDFRLLPQEDSGAPEIVLWSVSGGWACDNAFIAAHNAAVEITACGEVNGYDVLSLAKDALKRIDTLRNTTA